MSLSSTGRGVPFIIQETTNDLPSISDTNLPVASEAKNLHKQTYNGQLTDEPQPGLDPLSVHDALIQQKSDLFQTNFDIATIFGEVINGQSLKFKQIILYYIKINYTLLYYNNKQAFLIFMSYFHAYLIIVLLTQ